MTRTPIPVESVGRSHALEPTLPTMYDLPSEHREEPGLPDEYHLWQAQLCSATFCPPNVPPEQVFIASDLNLYYDPQHTGWYKRPDWFAVVGVPKFFAEGELRLSYVIWQERIQPTVVIEFLSPSTRDEDLGKARRKGEPPTKWEVYEQILAIPYYILFDRYTNDLFAYHLTPTGYSPIPLTEPKVWIPPLQLGLGLWQGEFQGDRQWLRWYDAQGQWILTPVEQERQALERERQALERERQAKERERQAKERERQAKERERQAKELALQEAERQRQRAEQLALRLRQAGIDPDQI